MKTGRTKQLHGTAIGPGMSGGGVPLAEHWSAEWSVSEPGHCGRVALANRALADLRNTRDSFSLVPVPDIWTARPPGKIQSAPNPNMLAA